MTPRVPKLLLFFLLIIAWLFPASLVLAQAEMVTQIRAFSGITWTQLLDVPVYGNSIVNHNFRTDGNFEVFDLEGNMRFSIDYDDAIMTSSGFHRFSFVEEVDLRNSDLAEVVFTFDDTDRNIHIRHFNERSELLYSEIIPASFNTFGFPYFFTDPVTQHGFLSYDLRDITPDSILVYPFSPGSGSFKIEGKRHGSNIYAGIPLVVYKRQDLIVGYDAEVQEVSRMEAKFGADKLTGLYVDFGRDGVLDAFSVLDTLIGGEDASRVIWYDNTDNIFLDTIVMGGNGRVGSSQQRWLLPSDGGYHVANFRIATDINVVELSFRSDNGTLIDPDASHLEFKQQICLEGISYLATETSSGILDGTLYSAQTGSALRTLPEEIFYEGQTASLQTVIGQCDGSLPEKLVFAYSQPSSKTLLLTSADTSVQAKVPYNGIASAYRFDGNVYAISDIDENGARASTVYRISEQLSSTQQDEVQLDLAIAPNPAQDYFQIIADKSLLADGPLDIQVYNLRGQEVASYSPVFSGKSLNTPIAPGMYIVQLAQPATGNRVTVKLVVQ